MSPLTVGQQVRLTQHVFGWPPGTEGTVGTIFRDPVGYIVDIPGPPSSGPDGRYASVYVRGDQLEPINEGGGS